MRIQDIEKMHEQAEKDVGYATHEVVDYRESWRIFKIMSELVEGYQFLTGMTKEVTVLGSARFKEDDVHYKKAQEFGRLCAGAGLTVITGGGPGIMEAANRGAHGAGGESIGLNIELPFEQVLNPYVTKFTSFNYFFTRKVMLTSPANAFILFPGGFGTMDEFFEVVDLMDLGMLVDVPIVLVGKSYWEPVLEFLRQSCCAVGTLTEDDIAKWHVVDTAEEAYDIVKDVQDVSHQCDLSPNNFHCEGNIDWKIFRVMAELVEGFDFLTGLNHNITVLGTRKFDEHNPFYHDAEQLGKLLAADTFVVVTGGKMGIAEATNKGAYKAGGTSIGLGMDLPNDPSKINGYVSNSLLFKFPFTRKLIVTAPSEGFVFFPGGFGTLHQLFEVLTLMQTGKMKRVPIILYGRAFWQPLHDLIKEHFVHDIKTINDEDDELYQIVDDVTAVMKIIGDYVV